VCAESNGNGVISFLGRCQPGLFCHPERVICVPTEISSLQNLPPIPAQFLPQSQARIPPQVPPLQPQQLQPQAQPQIQRQFQQMLPRLPFDLQQRFIRRRREAKSSL